MTINEAAEALGRHPSTLRHQIRNDSLKATKRGRDWWVTGDAVRHYRKHYLGRHGKRPPVIDR